MPSIHASNNIYPGSKNNNWSPRVAFSWAPTKDRFTTVHAGTGLYYEQISLRQVLDQLRGNPPGWVFPSFGANTGNSTPPIYSFGSSNVPPNGFAIAAIPAGQTDAHGGIVGQAIPVQGLDPNVKTPPTLNYTLDVTQEFGHKAVAAVTYTGSYSWNQLSATDLTGWRATSFAMPAIRSG